VLLGVNQHYYIPLIICRSFSTIFALVWAAQACLQIYRLWDAPDARPDERGAHDIANVDTTLIHRLQLVQVALSFLWVRYTAHRDTCLLCASPFRHILLDRTKHPF